MLLHVSRSQIRPFLPSLDAEDDAAFHDREDIGSFVTHLTPPGRLNVAVQVCRQAAQTPPFTRCSVFFSIDAAP
jgi:hypothetical protein